MTRPVTSQQTAHDLGQRALTVALMTLMTLMSWCLVGVASAAPVGASVGQPAVPADSPWLPWLGCWQLVEETAAHTGQPGGLSRFADRVVVCLTPSAADSAGVEVTTIADGELVLVETLLADGAQHPVEETACTGWRRSTWSGDRARLFARAELACDDQETRRVSGVGLMTSSTTWLDIQLVSSGGRGEVTVRRYRRASESTTVDAGATPLPADVLDRALAAARLASTAELSVNDVIEAGAAVHPAVVEAMLVETRASFALDRRTLLRLDDSGVPAEVIDLMVALSFPDEFVVERPPARTAVSFGSRGGGFVDPFSPYGFDRWYPYYASPFGYYYGWSPYSSLYYPGPAASYVIVLDALDGGSTGRTYSGHGYSQIGVREPTTDRRAQRRTVRGGTTGTTAEPSGGGSAGTSGSSDGGQATPGGYTRGGSSGRTARPRDR